MLGAVVIKYGLGVADLAGSGGWDARQLGDATCSTKRADRRFTVVPFCSNATLTVVCFVMGDVHLTVQARGTVALPPAVRRRHGLDGPGAQVRLVERDDGVIELHPLVAVPADQAWFWSERWQRMEREADDDVAAGRVVVTDGPDEFIGELDSDR